MFNVGSVVDNKYTIAGLCNSTGGMGTILFVKAHCAPTTLLVLKYCNYSDDETKNRFRREVRVMQEFNGNFYVAPIIDANLEHVPPYFVMPYFEHGDLTKQVELIRKDLVVAESYFNRMIDCIEQLHSKNVFHRDIKPQNFLVGNGNLVVSDFGLCREHDSSTNFTRASAWAGTPRYMPPEFQNGGFRNADAPGDIYMLGLTFRDMLFGDELPQTDLPQQVNGISVVIDRAIAYDKNRRYQSLSALRQSLTSAFDLALGRVVDSGGVLGTLQSIVDKWKTYGQSDWTEIGQFVDELSLLPQHDQHRVCLNLPSELFQVVARTPLPLGRLSGLVQIYLGMSNDADYEWSFAESIASNMAVLFTSPLASQEDKADALKAAIIAAIRQNRFAAMDTCTAMIVSITEGGLAQRVFEVMIEHPSYFLENIDPLMCRSPAIRQAIAILKANSAAVAQRAPFGGPFPI